MTSPFPKSILGPGPSGPPIQNWSTMGRMDYTPDPRPGHPLERAYVIRRLIFQWHKDYTDLDVIKFMIDSDIHNIREMRMEAINWTTSSSTTADHGTVFYILSNAISQLCIPGAHITANPISKITGTPIPVSSYFPNTIGCCSQYNTYATASRGYGDANFRDAFIPCNGGTLIAGQPIDISFRTYNFPTTTTTNPVDAPTKGASFILIFKCDDLEQR